jgi:hypothetical protein
MRGLYREQQVHTICAVLLTRFERSVDVLGYSNDLKVSTVTLELHTEQKEIIPRDITKFEKGNKSMNRQTEQLNDKRKNEGKKWRVRKYT